MDIDAVQGVVGRRYQIVGELGHGGMGRVYRAKDRLGGVVALKRLSTSLERAQIADDRRQRQETAAIGQSPFIVTRALDSASGWSAERMTQGGKSAFATTTFDLGLNRTALAVASHAPTLHRSTEPPQSGPRSTTPPDPPPVGELLRMTLAREFRMLSSLRHPNIISVLDYGFDEEGRPYFTMELLENARPIMRAAQGESFTGKLDLLGQMLLALAYLHRRGVIHRDLKPGNVLVESGRVKVLDFGVSILREQDDAARVLVGTLAYMAPELLMLSPATEASDLYAIGVIAYELFAEEHPFDTDNVLTLQRQIMDREPNLSALDPRVAPVIGRLLAKSPEGRYRDIGELIAALRDATSLPIAIETTATRESFLQAAKLVGRDAELATLTQMLDGAMNGRGGALLIGGESGVGKSRILDELRVRALVEGAIVLRGQGVSEGASPYNLFADVLRWLALLSDMSDVEASVLKPAVPDIGALLGREIEGAPELDPEGARARLLAVVEDIIRRQTQPILMILEDLHWAGADSAKLLARIAEAAPALPLLVIGSYRDDEREGLPRELPMMRVMHLARLDASGVADLCASMLGESGRDPNVLGRMVQETEGNPFFLVEVVRALAEEAGGLQNIGVAALPARVLSGGMHLIVRRRLSRVPEEARSLLTLAAVIGRRVDPALLAHASPSTDVEAWLSTCASVAVLDVHEGSWRFAHDKLREALLAGLNDADRRSLNRTAGEAIEAVYPNAIERATVLAHHFRLAGDAQREAHYAAIAGEQALRSAAYAQAIELFARALALMPEVEEEPEEPRSDRPVHGGGSGSAGGPSAPTPPTDAPLLAVARRAAKLVGSAIGSARPAATSSLRFQRGRIEGLLAQAYYKQGEVRAFREHGERAMKLFGFPMPSSQAGLAAGLLQQVAVRALQSAAPKLFEVRSEDERVVRQEAAHVQDDITSACLFAEEALPCLWSGLRVLNLGDPAGPSTTIVAGYGLMGMVAGTVPLRSVAEAWGRRALVLGRALRDTEGQLPEAIALARKGVFEIYVARFDEAHAGFTRARDIAAAAGDYRLWEEATSLLATVHMYKGELATSEAYAEEVYRAAKRHGHTQPQWWAISLLAQSLSRVGRAREMIQRVEDQTAEIEERGLKSDVLYHYAMRALVYLRSGDRDHAMEWGDKALELLRATRPVAYWNQQSATAIAEVMLTLWESSEGWPAPRRYAALEKAKQACDGLDAYKKVFVFAEPSALLERGIYEHFQGNKVKARKLWERAAERARSLSMPYEEGRAHAELGTRLVATDPARRRHLVVARDILSRIGASDDLDRVERELGEGGGAVTRRR